MGSEMCIRDSPCSTSGSLRRIEFHAQQRHDHRPDRESSGFRLVRQISQIATGAVDLIDPLVNRGNGNRCLGFAHGDARFLPGAGADPQCRPGNFGRRQEIAPVPDFAAEFAEQRGLYLDRGARTITCIEAMKTIAYEIAEQLTDELGPPKEPGAIWRTPTGYVQASSGGMGPIGVSKGFKELALMGLTHDVPATAAIQAAGCAPMVIAWQQNLEEAAPVTNPQTHIETLATGTPGRTYSILRKICKEDGGLFESVTDEEAYRAMHMLAKMEGISACLLYTSPSPRDS